MVNDTIPSKYILVIDDEPDIREIVQVSLECTRPWQVLEASSATEGLAIAQKHNIDAILLDINMTDMDGVGLLKILKQSPKTAHIPILFLTASTQATNYSLNEKTVLDLGASGMIKKPFDPGTLADQIDNTLQW